MDLAQGRTYRAKTDVAKRKRDAGPEILNPSISTLEVMDEAPIIKIGGHRLDRYETPGPHLHQKQMQ